MTVFSERAGVASRRTGSGALLALLAAALMATQDPLSGPGAKALTGVQFVAVTQASLLFAAPLLLLEPGAAADFLAILRSSRDRWRLLALTGLGLAGLALYNLGLAGAHPVVVTAILNLSPFWAALAARTVAGVHVPVGMPVFVAALLGALAGAVVVALSQSDMSQGLGGLFKGAWYFALPVPLFTALSATLVAAWFKDYHQSAAVAAALFTPPLAILPVCALYLWTQAGGFAFAPGPSAMLVAGTLIAAAFGRLVYQLALQATQGDNGFVTMFFLLAPGLSGVYSWALSAVAPTLAFHPNATYFSGLFITALSLLAFLLLSKKRGPG